MGGQQIRRMFSKNPVPKDDGLMEIVGIPLILMAACLIAVSVKPWIALPQIFFGRGLENNGEMPRLPVYILALIGLTGVLFGLFWL